MSRWIAVLLMIALLVMALITQGLDGARARAGASADLIGDAARGDTLFRVGVNGSPPCATCHQTSAGAFGFAVAPNLSGIGQRAAAHDGGASAYIAQSILEPSAVIVPGYRNIMIANYADHFNEQDMADLVAYLLSLE